MGLTATLCERIAAARFEDLPPEAIAAARRLVLDGLAVGVAGVAEEDAVPILARCMRDAWRRRRWRRRSAAAFASIRCAPRR